jgi:colicin import membrane protein
MLDKPGFAATTVAQRDVFRPKRPGGMSRGALLAIGAHGLLILALALGLRWRTSTPEVVSAELWSPTPQQAAPPAPTPVEPPPPPPAPPPPPEPVVRAPPPPPAVQPDTREADIALERQREAQRRAEEEKRERERRELQARKEKERQEVEKREQEKRELQARKEADEKKKREAAEAKREQEEQLRVVRQRDEQLKRMHQQIGAGSTATGTAARDASISNEYAGRIRARIKPNIVFAEDTPGNPTAVVVVGVAPSGKIISRKLEKSSGNKAWDDAVLRAIDRTDVLPRDVDGSVPSSIELAFRPNE